MIAHVCLRHKFVDLGVMAPDLLRWGDDLISEPADYIDDLFDDELNGVSDSDDVRALTTSKDKFTSSIVADKNYLYDLRSFLPHLQVSAISIPHVKHPILL